MEHSALEVDLASAESTDILSDFAVPFKDLMGNSKSREAGVKKMASGLDRIPQNGAIQLTLRNGRSKEHWCLGLTPAGCNYSKERTDSPDLEIMTDVKTWGLIASGKIPPLAAYVAGALRIRGDITLARSMVRRLR